MSRPMNGPVSGLSGPMNILLIEDEPRDCAFISELLTTSGCNVVPARSGTAALRQILKTDFALIILDVSMPDMDGFEVASLIRQVKRSSHVPIVFLTAAGDTERPVFRGCGTGVVDYLTKPVDADALTAMIVMLAGHYAPIPRATLGAMCSLGDPDDDLEAVIRERTTSLIHANERLRAEVERRERAEEGLRCAKAEADAANRAKSEFLANMSHEIRTPMNGIVGMMELALQTQLTDEQREYLGLVKISADALLTVINDILDFSKIEAGSLEVETIPFSLRESIGDTMKTLALDACRKGLELAYDVDAETPEILLGDPVRLRQILINLVGNAIKFTECGEVVVRVRPAASGGGAQALQFAVCDSGIGIPDEKLQAIFSPFAQADSSTSRLYGGTGLGLSIAARLVEIMGGRICVDSEPGRGTIFRFTLPLQAAGTAEEAVEPCFPGMRALVVEDHPVSRRRLARLLRQWRIEVYEATNGRSATGAISRSRSRGMPFDLVLLDDSLPDADSYGLAAQWAASATAQTEKLVVLGSILRREVNGAQLDHAAFSCLTKPVKQSELLAMVAAAAGHAAEAAPEAGATQDTPPQAAAVRPLDILLAEDNAVSSRVARQVLARAGHRVLAVDSGTAALAALERSHFDLVLMDVQMPGMDGLETTGIIREWEKASGVHVPIVALTAHAMPQHRERCLAAGMDGYLVKPIQTAELLALVAVLGGQAASGNAAEASAADAVAPGAARGALVLRQAALLDRVGGDVALLEEVTDLFLDNRPHLMAYARTALADGDALALGYAVHTLSGMFRTLCADAAAATAERLEAMIETGPQQAMEEVFTRLESEVDLLTAALIAITEQAVARRAQSTRPPEQGDPDPSQNVLRPVRETRTMQGAT